MAYATLSLGEEETIAAEVITSGGGQWILIRAGEVSVYLHGYDSVAVVNARAWAKALTDAADQIVERLERETVTSQEAV